MWGYLSGGAGVGGLGHCLWLVREKRVPFKNKPTLFSIFFFSFFLFKISCPGVFLPDKQDVYLGVYLLNQYLETNCFPSVFPIMIQQRMRFQKVILTWLTAK